MSERDPHAVLGVRAGDTPDHIRKAYRRLARMYHPDRNDDPTAAERFAEIAWAWEQLRNRPQQEPATAAYGLDEDFERLFGAAAVAITEPTDPPVRGDDVIRTIVLGVDAALQGTTVQVPVDHPVHCGSCDGKGCTHCVNGIRVITRDEAVIVTPGTSDGQRLRLRGRGAAGVVDGVPGDLVIEVRLSYVQIFEPLGDGDLMLDLPVTVSEAVLGGTIRIPTPDSVIDMALPAGTSSGELLRIAGRGLPIGDGRRGDLYARVLITIPTQIPERMRHVVEDLAEFESARVRARLFDPELPRD